MPQVREIPALAQVPAGTVLPEYADHQTARALFGLSRSYLYMLATEGSIRTVNVLRPGATKGRRLFDCASIRELMQASAMSWDEPALRCFRMFCETRKRQR